MSARKRLIENISSLFVLQAANYVLPLITLPYLVRVLGWERFGLIAFAQAFAQYFMVLTDYGFNLTATRQISIHRKDSRRISEIFSTVMVVKLGLMLLSGLLMAGIVFAVPRFRVDWPVYSITFLMVVGGVLFPVWFFQGMEKMKYITALNVTTKTAAVLAIFMLVRSRSDYLMAAFLLSVGSVGAGVLGLAAVRLVSRVSFIVPTLQEAKGTLTEGRHVFVAQMCASVFGPTNVIILGLFASHGAVGLYSVAEKIVRAGIVLSTPVTTAIYPRVSELFAQSREVAIVFLRKILLSGGAVFLGLSLFLFLGAELAALLVSGEANRTISILIRIMAILPFTIFVDNIYGTQIMLNVGMEKQFKSAVVRSALFSLMLSLLLVPTIGALGSACAFLCSEILVLILMVLPVHRAGIRLHRVSR